MKKFNEFLIEEGIFSSLGKAGKAILKVPVLGSELKNFGSDLKDAILKPLRLKDNPQEVNPPEWEAPHTAEEIVDLIYNHYLNDPHLIETKTFKMGKVPFVIKDLGSDKEAFELLHPVSFTDKSTIHKDNEDKLKRLQNVALDRIYRKSIDVNELDFDVMDLITQKCTAQAVAEVYREKEQFHKKNKEAESNNKKENVE